VRTILTTALGSALALTLAAPAAAGAAEPGDPWFTGTVTTTDGLPLAGAIVRLTGHGEALTTSPTDAEGRYEIQVPAGTYLVCAGKVDRTVHHSCSPGNPLGTGATTWPVTAVEGEEELRQTLDFTLAPSGQPLVAGDVGATSAAWQRTKKGYRLVYSAAPVVYRTAETEARIRVVYVRVDALRTFNGTVSPFTVDVQRVGGFPKGPEEWAGIVPLPAVSTGPVLFEEASCGLPADQGPGRPPRMHAVPTIVQQVRSGGNAVLLSRETPVDESACRRDRLTLAVRGLVRGERRVIRMSARTDSAVQVYRPKARIFRNGKLIAKRRLRADGSAALVKLPKKFRKRTVRLRIVLPATNGSPRFVENRVVRFPRR
jgi:hypothetical protein